MNFRDLKVGDKIWIVYNRNWYQEDLPEEYIIEQCIIEDNHDELRELSSIHEYSLYEYNNPQYKKEYFISFNFNNQIYSRYYDDFYNERSQMTMTPQQLCNAPILEIFISKNEAKKYLTLFCNNQIIFLKEKIEQLQNKVIYLTMSVYNALKT